MTDVSFIIPLRNQERTVARTVRQAAEVGRSLEIGDERGPRFEILALDERSGDNTLALLSLLHGQIPELRTVQDLAPGRALARGVRLAQGELLVVLDHPTDVDLLRWAGEQVARGHRAAVVPGEVLAVRREEAVRLLAGRRAGLVGAQQVVATALGGVPRGVAYSPPPPRSVAARTRMRARTVAARLGLGRLDHPGK